MKHNLKKILLIFVIDDAPPNSLLNSNVNPKVKIMGKKIMGIRSLTRNILGVKGHAGVLGWGLRQMLSGSIIHTDMHKPNNKLVRAWLVHFWCTNEPHAYMNSQDSPRLGL